VYENVVQRDGGLLGRSPLLTRLSACGHGGREEQRTARHSLSQLNREAHLIPHRQASALCVQCVSERACGDAVCDMLRLIAAWRCMAMCCVVRCSGDEVAKCQRATRDGCVATADTARLHGMLRAVLGRGGHVRIQA
jgi:hypothetical protein